VVEHSLLRATPDVTKTATSDAFYSEILNLRNIGEAHTTPQLHTAASGSIVIALVD